MYLKAFRKNYEIGLTIWSINDSLSCKKHLVKLFTTRRLTITMNLPAGNISLVQTTNAVVGLRLSILIESG